MIDVFVNCFDTISVYVVVIYFLPSWRSVEQLSVKRINAVHTNNVLL
jgi:hypothetical protein